MGPFAKKKNSAIENLSNMGNPRYMREDMKTNVAEQKKKTADGMRAQTEKQVAYMKKITPRPKAMEYFDTLAGIDSPRIKELQDWKAKGGKVVGTLCVFAPNEIILASGAKLVRLCSGHYDAQHPANELLGDAGLCPLVKATLGGKMVGTNPYFELCDMVVGPATCDGKMKLGEILAEFIPVVMVIVPRVMTGETLSKLWVEEMTYLMHRLEELTGKKLKRSALKKAIKDYNEMSRLWKNFMELRKQPRVSLWGRDMLLVSQMALIDEPARWCENVKKLTEEVKAMHAKGQFVARELSPRLFLGGSPIVWPNWKIPNISEESDGIIIADELCSSSRLLQDPIVQDEGFLGSLLRAVAERYLYPCTCPCFTPNDERTSRMNTLITDYKLDGLIHHVLRGCHLNNLEASRIDQNLRKRSTAMLKIESEYDEGDVEQIRTRIEAFLEMIKSRKEYEKGGKQTVEAITSFDDSHLEDMKKQAEAGHLVADSTASAQNKAPAAVAAAPARPEAYAIGIDVGALSTKVVLVKGGKIVDFMQENTSRDPNALAQGMVDKILAKNNLKKEQLKGIASTGQGKESIDFATARSTEISAFAKGAKALHDKVRMVIDIGGQGIRVMELDPTGVMSSFRTNDKCSTGTGVFLDTMAASLDVPAMEMGKVGGCSSCPSSVVATCTVFAESEMVSLVAKKVPKPDIVAGLNKMVAKKVASVANGMGIKGDVMLAGGVARNQNVVDGFKSEVKHNVIVPENPHLVGAYGAALILLGGA